MPIRSLQSALLTLALLGLAACGSDPETPASSSGSTSSSSAEPTGTTTPSPPPLTAEEQAASDAALDAYNGAWALEVLARRDPGAKPDWSLDYRQFYAEPLLSEALSTIYGLRDAGITVPVGEPTRAPAITDVDLEPPMQVAIADCVDTRPWPSLDASGAVVSTERPPSPLTARASYDAQLQRWLIVEQEADLEATC